MITEEYKICIKCKRLKSDDEFYFDKGYQRPECKKCQDKDRAIHRKLIPEKTKLWAHHANIKRYGISVQDYQVLLKKQNSVCSICKEVEKKKQHLSIDHSHFTQKVHGLLCDRCNRLLGLCQDNSAILIRAAEYLIGGGV